MKWLENITDKDKLQENLTFASLYIAIYEHMTDYVVSNLKAILCDWKIEDGKEIYTDTDVYKNEIKNRIVDEKGNKDITKASFLWLVDNDAIVEKDYQLFLDAKDLRNRYAHELTTVMYQGIAENDVKVFFEMFEMYQRITKWGFVNFEATIMGEELPENIDFDQVQTTANIMFGMILEVLYNGKSDEYKTFIKLLKKEND